MQMVRPDGDLTRRSTTTADSVATSRPTALQERNANPEETSPLPPGALVFTLKGTCDVEGERSREARAKMIGPQPLGLARWRHADGSRHGIEMGATCARRIGGLL